MPKPSENTPPEIHKEVSPDVEVPKESIAQSKEATPQLTMEQIRSELLPEIKASFAEVLSSAMPKKKEDPEEDADTFVNEFFSDPKKVIQKMLSDTKNEVLNETKANMTRQQSQREFWNKYKEAHPDLVHPKLIQLAEDILEKNANKWINGNKSVEEAIELLGAETKTQLNGVLKAIGAEIKEVKKPSPGVESGEGGIRMFGVTPYQDKDSKKDIPKLGDLIRARRKKRVFNQKGAD